MNDTHACCRLLENSLIMRFNFSKLEYVANLNAHAIVCSQLIDSVSLSFLSTILSLSDFHSVQVPI